MRELNMTFRWFGDKFDSIPLGFIGQIPGVKGAVCSLMDVPVGEVWTESQIEKMKMRVRSYDLHMEVIESVNIHEDIKLGLSTRDGYIENYRETIRALGRAGVKVICYNFMPVLDWLRTDFAKVRPDGSTVMAYDKKYVIGFSPEDVISRIQEISKGCSLPGWEPERLKPISKLIDAYKGVTREDLHRNLTYFLEQIIPVCEEYDVKMALHPDDPPWDMFGLPRIAGSKADLDRIIKSVDSPYNGLTICTGSLGANGEVNIPDVVRYFGEKKKIHFAHIRNVKIQELGVFEETAHYSEDGSFDVYEILKAYDDVNYTGYIRPDHGRMIWGETGRPGYGLYDRALGISYMSGIWEAIQKGKI